MELLAYEKIRDSKGKTTTIMSATGEKVPINTIQAYNSLQYQTRKPKVSKAFEKVVDMSSMIDGDMNTFSETKNWNLLGKTFQWKYMEIYLKSKNFNDDELKEAQTMLLRGQIGKVTYDKKTNMIIKLNTTINDKAV